MAWERRAARLQNMKHHAMDLRNPRKPDTFVASLSTGPGQQPLDLEAGHRGDIAAAFAG
jgi:hypothetical protein